MEGKLELEFAFPWAALIAALTGGLAGGFIRHHLKLTRADLIVSVLVGALVAALYAQGVNALGLELSARTGEILTFVIAALGAFGGTTLLARLTSGRAAS